MSKNFRVLRLAAVPVVLGALATSASGCSAADDIAGGGCNAELSARVESLQGSVKAMSKLAVDLRVKVATACKNIAEAGGETVMMPAEPSDDDVKSICGKAEAQINANLMAAGSVSIELSGGKCTVNAEAQVSCEGSCKVDASCTEPELEVRCSGGNLSVSCEGTCEGTATCEGSATVAAECEGVCEGSCEGTCEGTCAGECDGTCATMNGDGSCNGQCMGTCKGQCDTTCTGTCKGSCKLEANAMVNCTAEARCEGSCMGTATAPTCEGKLAPPKCEANAECQANCEGSANLQAECTPPSVKLVFSGTVDADFLAALEANLGVFFSLEEQGKLVVDTAGKIVSDFEGIVSASATCAASLAGEIKAAIEASVSIKASVSVSASASGSASGGT